MWIIINFFYFLKITVASIALARSAWHRQSQFECFMTMFTSICMLFCCATLFINFSARPIISTFIDKGKRATTNNKWYYKFEFLKFINFTFLYIIYCCWIFGGSFQIGSYNEHERKHEKKSNLNGNFDDNRVGFSCIHFSLFFYQNIVIYV